jgi:hypothetical protein
LPRCKAIINILWGGLAEKKVKKKIISDKTDTYKQPNDTIFTSIKPSLHNEDETIIEYANNDSIYKSGWARLSVFIISKAKAKISKIIEPYKEICIRSHTDSMLLTTRPENLKLGNKIGEIAYEGYCNNTQVLNSMKVIGDFII